MSTFRTVYRPLTTDEAQHLVNIKDKAGELLDLFNQYPNDTAGRELALARTKLEEAVMWAVKGVTG